MGAAKGVSEESDEAPLKHATGLMAVPTCSSKPEPTTIDFCFFQI